MGPGVMGSNRSRSTVTLGRVMGRAGRDGIESRPQGGKLRESYGCI